MADPEKRLLALSSPEAESLSDYERINEFCRAGRAAAAEIERLRTEAANAERRELRAVEQAQGYRREAERLRAAFLRRIREENQCRADGQCSDAEHCGCVAEMREALNNG